MTNIQEALAWLSYTYLFVRMLKNPLAYGIPWEEVAMEPRLEARRRALVQDAARKLEQVIIWRRVSRRQKVRQTKCLLHGLHAAGGGHGAQT